jgi:proline dehydrogenase
MFKFIAGNHFNHAIHLGNKLINNNKFPIINFAVENTLQSKSVFNEYNNLIQHLPDKFSIAIKLSSFNFDHNYFIPIIETCKDKNIKVFIDAENIHSYQKYNDISTQLLSYNDNIPFVHKTYQMYRRDSLLSLHNDINFCHKYNCSFGAKLVRGAYWNSEKNLPHIFNYKNDTDFSFNSAIYNISMNHYNLINPSIVLATHNTFSSQLGLFFNKTTKHSFDFAHLQGMNDKYYQDFTTHSNVYVYIPYGPYHKMLPYLTRRLYENLDIFKSLKF